MIGFEALLSYLLVGLFLFSCLLTGFKDIRRIKTLKDFALCSPGMSTTVLVATIYATHMGAGATLGLIEAINDIGIICAGTALIGVFHWKISNLIYCKNINKFAGCMSQPHIMKKLYGTSGLWVSNIVNILLSIGIIAIQVMVIGFVAQSFLHILNVPQDIGIWLAAGIVIIYSISGGVKAVIATDVGQVVLFLIVIAIVFILSIEKFAFQPDFFDSISANKLWITPYDWHSCLLTISLLVWKLLPCGEEAPFLQRMLISGSSKQLEKAFGYVALIDFIVIAAIASIAIMLLPSTGDTTLSKHGIFEMIRKTMHPVLIVIVMIGILAVAMSTADSWLNAAAVIIAHDIVKKVKYSYTDKQEVLIARLATLFLGIVATTLALSGKSVLSLLLLVENLYKPLIFIPIIAGFLGSACTEKDFKRSVVCALVGVALGAYLEEKLSFISLLFGLLGSAIGLWARKILRLHLPPKVKPESITARADKAL